MKTELSSPADVPGASARKGMPRDASAALATLVDEAPGGDAWVHETKYDGYRILALVDGDDVVLRTRNAKDWTARFAPLARELGSWNARAVLDGEVVVFDRDGISSFQRLQDANTEDSGEQLVYVAFDLLWWDGQDLRGTELRHRKAALRSLFDHCRVAPSRGPIRFSPHSEGDGPDRLNEACRQGLEGIICKKADSGYRGRRTRDWLKVKCTRRQEFVIGGFTQPSGSREGFGSLLLGVYQDHGKLRYSGRVGTGFNNAKLRELRRKLDRLTRKTPPFDDPPEEREAAGVTWVRPTLVAEVAFAEWTDDGRLRHPAFQGLRDDKNPRDVRREHR